MIEPDPMLRSHPMTKPLELPVLQLPALEAAALCRDPFDFVQVPHFVASERLGAVCRDFPKLSGTGSYPLNGQAYGPAFGQLIAELTGPEIERAIGEKFDLDLSLYPTLITLRGRVGPRDGYIHTDSETKILTLLLYLNEDWLDPAGRLRLLRGPDDLENFAAEIEPSGGNLLVFRRSAASFHGHYPVSGPRRALQMNWVVDAATRDKELRRHGRSAWLKRFRLPVH